MSYPEAPDHTGIAPKHKKAAERAKAGEANNTPMLKKDFDYFMRKFNLTPKTDRRIKAYGRIQREYDEGTVKRGIIINIDTDKTKWHEVGHLIAEDIASQEFKKEGEMVLLNSLRNFQITDEEFEILIKLVGREEIELLSQLREDIKKIINSIPPYNTIPESEKNRIIRQYKDQTRVIEKTMNYLRKPTEVFANYFSILQTNRQNSISHLPRLHAQWGEIIDSYMRDA